MLELTFYKGVPFDSENENVLFCSKQDRDEFLEQYEINVVPIQLADKWFLNGTDEQCFLTVSLNQEPFNANYLKVIQTLVEPKTLVETRRVLFFFINSYRQGAENSIELNLTLDKWNSYFIREENEIIEMPQLKNALCIQGHRFENGGEIEEIIQPDKSLNYFNYSSLSNKTAFRIVYHISTASEKLNETCLISKTNYSFNNAMRKINSLSQIATVVLRTENSQGDQTQEDVAIKPIDVFLVPDELFGESPQNILEAYDFATAYFSGNETIFFHTANLTKYGNGITFNMLNVFQVTPERGKITWVGTGKTNINIPFNNKTFNVYFRCVIGNDFSIQMFGNNQTLTLTQDFQVNFSYSEFAQYVSTHKNSEKLRDIKTAIGGFGASATILGGIATGNLKAVAGGAVALGGVAMSEFDYESKMKDMKSQPLNLATDTENILILYAWRGLAKFVLEPANYDDIIAYDNYYGYNFNGFYDTLIIANEIDDRFRFVKCSDIQIIGEFNFDVKKYFEYLFKRGLRIWYNKKHFIDSMKQKLTQEEIEE